MAYQCGDCKRKYKHVANYERHAAICSLLNSQAVKDSMIHDTTTATCSDKEALDTQVPSNARLFAAVRHLVGVVNQLQTKVSHLEQLAYIRRPKPDMKSALMAHAVKPDATFCSWVLRTIAPSISRTTLTECVFRHANLADAMCKIIMKHVPSSTTLNLAPIYAAEAKIKTGAFMVYDSGTFSAAVAVAENNDTIERVDDESNGSNGSNGCNGCNEWRPITSDAFRWMVNAVHKQLLGEYHAWTLDSNDNSDEFIETSMRYGSIILGGNMEWPAFLAKLNTKLWTVLSENQTCVMSAP
jgi:hypothetical protein